MAENGMGNWGEKKTYKALTGRGKTKPQVKWPKMKGEKNPTYHWEGPTLQVALFIMALVFLIFAFSTAIMALEHELTDFADAQFPQLFCFEDPKKLAHEKYVCC